MYIYGLFDPRTNELRYVGKTSQILRKRLKDHIAEAKMIKYNNHKDNWIRSLLKIGPIPEISPLQETNEIYDKYWNKNIKAKELAAKYHTSDNTITKIINNKYYKENIRHV